ncbi:MAG: hypothetical protein K2V38_20035, partial [Gemmataceae bacterium]|nr:hypothetical protein [Gemmataceae bacterium]
RADDATALLGKWEVVKSTGDTPKGSVVEFAKDGKLAVVLKTEGKETRLAGTYALTGKKLSVKLTLNEQKIEHEFTIALKGDDELTLEDTDKKTDTLKRKK